jgi:hypothetical protein
MRSLAFLAAAALLVCAAPAGHAQPAQPAIRTGQTVDGRLGAGDARDEDNGRWIDAYRYQGRAGERIAIDIASTDFHTLFRIGQMAGGRFRELDRVSILTRGKDYHAEAVLPADGEYVIRVGSWMTVREGAYRMTLQKLATPDAPDAGAYDGLYGLDLGRDAGCVLSVQDFGAGRIRFQVSCMVSPATTPDAWLAGVIPIANGQAVYRTTEHGGTCELRFRFRERQAEVAQTGSPADCGFRRGASAAGTYRWVRREPLFQQRPQ